MRLRLKATGFLLSPWLEELAEDKILKPLTIRIGRTSSPESFLDVELSKVTRHHNEGRIWKCEINLPLPGAGKTLYVEAIEESLEDAVDRAKEELEREIATYRGSKTAKAMRLSRRIKEQSRKS